MSSPTLIRRTYTRRTPFGRFTLTGAFGRARKTDQATSVKGGLTVSKNVKQEKRDVRDAKQDLRDDKKHGSNKEVRESRDDLQDEKQDLKKAKRND